MGRQCDRIPAPEVFKVGLTLMGIMTSRGRNIERMELTVKHTAYLLAAVLLPVSAAAQQSPFDRQAADKEAVCNLCQSKQYVELRFLHHHGLSAEKISVDKVAVV